MAFAVGAKYEEDAHADIFAVSGQPTRESTTFFQQQAEQQNGLPNYLRVCVRRYAGQRVQRAASRPCSPGRPLQRVRPARRWWSSPRPWTPPRSLRRVLKSATLRSVDSLVWKNDVFRNGPGTSSSVVLNWLVTLLASFLRWVSDSAPSWLRIPGSISVISEVKGT